VLGIHCLAVASCPHWVANNLLSLCVVLLQELPLEGGPTASASAAAILQTVCAPIPAAAGGAGAGASSKEAEASNGSLLAAAAAASAGGADATFTAAVQQKVLAAGGLRSAADGVSPSCL